MNATEEGTGVIGKSGEEEWLYQSNFNKKLFFVYIPNE
jgi:hypothetical protein